MKVTAVDDATGMYYLQSQSVFGIEVKENDIQTHILDVNMTEHLLLSLGFYEDKSSEYAVFNNKCFRKNLIADGVGFTLVIVKTAQGFNFVYSKDGQTRFQPIGAYCDLQKQSREKFGYELPFCLSRLATVMGYETTDTCYALFDCFFDISIDLRYNEEHLLSCKPQDEECLQKEYELLKTRLLALCKQISEIYKQTTAKTDCLEALHQQMIMEHQRYF